jgi:hypothetical protein
MLHRNVQKLDPREQHYWIESPRQGMQLFLRYLPPLTRQTGEVRPVLYVHGEVDCIAVRKDPSE